MIPTARNQIKHVSQSNMFANLKYSLATILIFSPPINDDGSQDTNQNGQNANGSKSN